MWWPALAPFCLLLLEWVGLSEPKALNDYILDYQELNYDPHSFHRSHNRVRRSIDSHLHLKFRAYNRNFHLKLKQDNTIFSPDHRHKNHDGSLERVDTSFIYHGSLVDQPKSYAHIAVINGTARGYVYVPEDTTYHIEPAEQFFRNPEFHSVIYSEKNLNLDPYRHKREAEHSLGSCGNDRIKEWMKETSESVIKSEKRNKRALQASDHFDSYRPMVEHNKYSQMLNRQIRSAAQNLGQKNTCYLYLRSDPMLWIYIKYVKYSRKSKTPLSNQRAKEEILAFFATHVSALKSIYTRTNFSTIDGSKATWGVNFLVQRTSIMINESVCGSQTPSPYCSRNIDVSNFLNLNSLDNHDDFCLAYVFTYRDFVQGTLGLAWVGSPSKAAGGICEKFKEYPVRKQRVKKSLNTGIVTIVNYGKSVPPRVSQLTFAHEVGHNFGSPHDSGPTCAPYGTNTHGASKGNYIMFASATMGDKDHNDEFSVCSKDNISLVLDAVVKEKHDKVNCFDSPKAAFCGNGIVEEGEECDCGYYNDCKNNDQCCHGKNSPEGTECKLKNVECSPTQGQCCKTDCNFVPKSQNLLCRNPDDCYKAAECNGTMAQCPESVKESNGTFCNSHSQVCLDGACLASVCSLMSGWEECFLLSQDDGKGPSREEMCFVSCKNIKTGKCVSSHNKDLINLPENVAFKRLLQNITRQKLNKSGVEAAGVQLPAGSPCDNFRGYCDVFHICRGVNADGPLARLKNLIFDPKNLQTVKEWITVNWWVVMLIAIGLVIFMGVFIQVCAVHTPSSNPNKPAARKLTLPRRHGHRGNQGQRTPQDQGHSNPNKPQGHPVQNPQASYLISDQDYPPMGPPPQYSGPRKHGKGARFDRRGMEMNKI